jgi:hypothetical protein
MTTKMKKLEYQFDPGRTGNKKECNLQDSRKVGRFDRASQFFCFFVFEKPQE